MKCRVSPVRRGIAGQVAFDVTFADGSKCSMVGSEYGSPGPVVMVTRRFGQVFVSDAAHYGDRFDRKWVERFFSDVR